MDFSHYFQEYRCQNCHRGVKIQEEMTVLAADEFVTFLKKHMEQNDELYKKIDQYIQDHYLVIKTKLKNDISQEVEKDCKLFDIKENDKIDEQIIQILKDSTNLCDTSSCYENCNECAKKYLDWLKKQGSIMKNDEMKNNKI